MSDTIISIRHLKKEYPNVTPLKDVNAEIKRGDVISIIGPSGTGKSTLLRCINLLEKPTDGEVLINGIPITAPKTDIPLLRQKMGMVFQSFNLFNHMTVIENITAAPMDVLHKTEEEARATGMELLRKVGLSDKADNFPDELSGGQKQRVAIARTLAMNPEIVLFDEPTSALDPTMIGEVLSVIRSLARQGLTMMIVTHEMNFARDVSTRVFYMDEGIIYEEGTPEEVFDNPKNEKTRQFINHLKVFSEHITTSDFDFIGLISRLEEFGRKHQISQKSIISMQHVFEELVMQTLIKNLPETFDLALTVEYSSENEVLVMKVNFNGEKFNPLEHCDELSLSIIKHHTAKYDFEWQKERNLLEIEIRG